ncbi:decapping and exoribonuclease protein [Diachasma alloeum]|uniref:decapping and exoribonuclease protein n=1 Tax=Diachasma alloeum TaxID=454923 RepID=UPI000738487C|nr:decapping and exoribonuclease protein [Diachasma alloeum]
MQSPRERSGFRVRRSWEGNFPVFKKPNVIGYWSVDGSRALCHDASRLQYYSPPQTRDVKFDLDRGIELVHRKPGNLDERISHILEWIKWNYPKIRANPESGRWLQPNFICYRGLLTKIMKTPYDNRDGWIICASKWRGSIYLCAFDTEADKEAKAIETPRQKQMASWGFKFEQYILADAPGGSPDASRPVDECEEFSCVFQTRLTQHWLLYGAEMDGVWSDEKLEDPLPLDKLKFVELKTSRIVENDRQLMSLERHKFLRWWCQSFLVGIESILCGFRDDAGVVRELQNYKIADIARNCQKYWKAASAMNFCDHFLRHVSSNVINDCDRTIYKFERVPNGDIFMTEVPPTPDYAVLPPWYMAIPP